MNETSTHNLQATGCFSCVILLIPILAAYALGYVTAYILH